MTEEISRLIESSCMQAVQYVPVKKWSRICIAFRTIRTYSQLEASYLSGKKSTDFFIEEDSDDVEMTDKLKDLREKMYETAPDKGAWYSCAFEIQADGSFKTNFEYDARPAFDPEPDPSRYKDDDETFPREKRPEWLKQILSSLA